MSKNPRRGFPTTHWSLVGRAGYQGDEELHRAALNDLLKRYLPALQAHLIYGKRIDVNEADDLVQGFVTNKVLERDLIQRAEPERGRFRSLLATALDNYVSSVRAKQGAAKRKADRAKSLDDDTYRHFAHATYLPITP